MKISNETKIGTIAIVAIVILFLGFSFLKGKNLFHKEVIFYANFHDVIGLKPSNPAVINGVQVGKILDIEGTRDMKNILVTISFSKLYDIPTNSIAVVNPNLLGSPTLEIQLGNSTTYLKPGDTLQATTSSGALDEALKVINPVLYEAKKAVRSLDSVFTTFTEVFDEQTRNNLKDVIANLNVITQSFVGSAKSAELMLDINNGAISKSLNHINSFTANLDKNNQKIDSIMQNVNIATSKLAALQLGQTLANLDSTITDLKSSIAQINSNNGTLGMLMNNKSLYENLEASTRKINILLDDIRVHPRRYVNISVFGKKDRKNYLTAPLTDSTQIANP